MNEDDAHPRADPDPSGGPLPWEVGQVEDPRADGSTPDEAMQSMYMLRWSRGSVARAARARRRERARRAADAEPPEDPLEPPVDEPHPYVGLDRGPGDVPRGRHWLDDLFRKSWDDTEQKLGRRMYREGDVVDWFDGRRFWRTKVAWIDLRHPPLRAVVSFDRGKRLLYVPFDSLTFVRHSTRKIRLPWEILEANRGGQQGRG